MAGKIVFVLGDIHANFGDLNDFIDKKIRKDPIMKILAEEEGYEILILQCGDMAFFWPTHMNAGRIKNDIAFLPGGRVKIYWCAGNHEDWDRLDALGTDISEVDAGVFFCPFGSTLELSPDITALFAGGAESVDHLSRFLKMCQGHYKIWWEQESISETDMARLVSVPKADWVISHTAPKCFGMQGWLFGNPGVSVPEYEESMIMLNRVYDRYRPKRWFFGHFHINVKGRYENCRWECLAYIRSREKFYEVVRI